MTGEFMINRASDKIVQIHEIITSLNGEFVKVWKEDVFLDWRWWLSLAILILPWVVWFVLRKKESTDRLLYAGLFVYFITTVLDSIGVPFGLWVYIVTPLPYIHSFYLPWDLSCFPVFTMLLIQYKPNVSPYIKAIIFAVASAFIAEPFFAWIKIYNPVNWKYIYGIPLYFAIYLMANFVSKRNQFKPVC